MGQRKPYRRKPCAEVTAVRLDLETEVFRYYTRSGHQAQRYLRGRRVL